MTELYNPTLAQAPTLQERGFTLLSNAETMPRSIFNTAKSDYAEAPLFFGQSSGIMDSLHTPHTKLLALHMDLKATDWKHTEFPHHDCVPQFETCPKPIYQRTIRTLAWQWEGDSVAGQEIAAVMALVANATEARVGYGRIADNENLHALSYSEIVKTSFKDPTTVLQEILSVREAFGRLATVGRVMKEAVTAAMAFKTNPDSYSQEMYEAIFMFVVAVYCLEAIQFMSSFAYTFGICDMGLFSSIGSIVQLICRDEYNNHVPFGEEVLRIELATDRGRLAFQNCREKILSLIREVHQSEMLWNDYANSDGYELPGLNKERFNAFSSFCARRAYVLFGMENEAHYDLPTELPLEFMNKWIVMSTQQVSPQEARDNNYQVGMVNAENLTKKIYGFTPRRSA